MHLLPRLTAILTSLAVLLPAAIGDVPFPTIDPAAIRRHVEHLASDEMNGRAFRSDEARLAAAWIAERLAEAGAKPLEGRDSMLVPVGRMPQAAPNVVAWHPPRGPKPSGEFVLVTAHYDHLPPRSSAREGEDRIYNGADDNASGVAGLLAVAGALRDDALDVGVVFVAFTGEEAGLIGSRAFLEEETLPPARIRGMFNMDMISRQPDGAIRLDGGPKGKVLVDLLVRLAPGVPLEMRVDTHPDWLDRSDQGPFLRAGIPAVLFSCEDHEDYHQVTDHADRIDATLAAKVAALVTGAVRTYAKEMAPRFDRSPILDAESRQLRPIRVGRTMPNAPYWKPATRRDPDRGIDAAILEELAKRTGWTFEEKSIPLGGELAALESGEVDLIANGFPELGIPEAGAGASAAGIVAVSYLDRSGIGALVAKDSPVSAAADLEGLRVAVRPGTSADRWRLGPGREIRATPETSPEGTIAGRIEKGELDAFLGDLLALESRAARNPALRVVELARCGGVYLLRAGDAPLGARLREAISEDAAQARIREIESRLGAR